ncbi:MAG: NAD(+)/NADH kinase [Candidatus Methanomethylophilaceae archaeon]|nr:NAD(+)/NADH kinase [Candidatus Methanomethylophilaceae archaeon]
MDIHILREIADAVQAAVSLIPDPCSRGNEICMGNDGTPTSEIDKVAENAVLGYIESNRLALNVLSEEIGFVDNGASEVLVLDPIDGTSNSVAEIPFYTISMAVGTGSLCGMHTAYIRNLATGDEFWARKGDGAYYNGRRINVRKPDFSKLFALIYMGNAAVDEAFALAKNVKTSRSMGCASLEMTLVALGHADIYYMNTYRYNRAVRTVDIAASALILREAGGEIFDIGGNKLDMPLDNAYHASFVACSCREVFDHIMRAHIEEHGATRYGIYANETVPGAAEYVRRAYDALRGEKVTLDTAAARLIGAEGVPISEIEADIVVVIGGDGTILRALKKTDAAVIGINAGGVGFLAEVEPDEIEESISRIRRGEYSVEERIKLRTFYEGEYLSEAVNETVIHTDSVAKIRQFKIYVNEHLATEVRADGIIISTPTGSTCYAMSLGAPITDPGVGAFLIVPMAAFKFASRPFVVPYTAKITVEAVMDKGCLIVVDGQHEYPMRGGTRAEFSLSDNLAKFIKLDKDFYSRVREKLVNAI